GCYIMPLLRRRAEAAGLRLCGWAHNLEGYVRSPARGLGVANGRPHISRIERSRRSMHAARGVSDEMLDGQVRLGGTFRHIWALEISQFRLTAITKTYPNIA